MKLKRFGALFFLISCAVLCVFFGQNGTTHADNEIYVNGTDCLGAAVHPDDTDLSSSDAAKISSLAAACLKCNGASTTSYGAMWINGFNVTNSPSGKLDWRVYYPSVDVSASATAHTVKGYLHGQAYSCVSTISAGGMPAGHIHFLEYAVPEHSYSEHTRAQVKAAQVDYIVNAEDIENEVLMRAQDGVGTYQWTKPNGTLEVQIDLDKFINGIDPISDPIIGDDGYEYATYMRTVHIYRCPNPSNHEVGDLECWSDPTEIIIEIPTKLIAKTCVAKYQGPGYDKTADVPDWYDSTRKIYYNKCSGTSILGSRVTVGGVQQSVRRSNGNNSGEDTIYVKPGDQVTFDHVFYSAAQLVSQTIISEGLTGAWTGSPSPNNWKNNYSISYAISHGGSGSPSTGSWSGGEDFGTPASSTLSVNYNFKKGHTGAPTENNSTNYEVGTGNSVTMYNNGSLTNLGSASIDELNVNGVTITSGDVPSVSLNVVAPYNYINTAEATANNNNKAYVGETASISGTFRTKGKINNRVVGGNSAYATVSPNTSYRLYHYYSDRSDGSDKNCLAGASGCELHEGSVASVAVNSDETADGSASNVYWHTTLSGSVEIPDISLGTTGKYLCVTAAIYPANSGADTSLDPNGSNSWDSQTICTQLAKKPTFQVRGGNLYTAGSIETNMSTKNNLDNKSVLGNFAFGSWMEHGVIAGKTNKAASGTALGYTSNSNGVLGYNYASGASDGSLCKYQPITIANNNCYSGSSSGNAGNSGVRVTASDTVNLDDYMDTARTKGKRVGNSADGVDLFDGNNYTEINGIRYTYADSSLNIKATSSLPLGTTHVIFATGTVTIVGNLQYNNTNNGAGYTKASEIPQYIIISNGNINVDYNVTRVDAWLIAKSGTINTCKNSTIGSESECAKQLRINGPVVAKDLELDRTYGAATGAYSAVPAEIINVSPSTYIFSQAKANASTSLRTVYSKEVAPRW